nr:hypothetical protein GA0070560_104329 [uncultured bacterium]
MENEERRFAWLAGFFRDGCEKYIRFMCGIYSGEPIARASEDVAQTSWKVPENAP